MAVLASKNRRNVGVDLHSNYLIKNGTIVDGTCEATFQGSGVVKDGNISEVLRNKKDAAALEENSASVVDDCGYSPVPLVLDFAHLDLVRSILSKCYSTFDFLIFMPDVPESHILIAIC